MEYIIETANLQKKYRSFIANDKITLKVPRGSIFGLIGRNGSGKTTLMKLILGFSNPTAGSISINGKTAERELWQERSKIGSIIEVPAFYNEMSCYSNTMYQAKLHGQSKTRVQEVLKNVGLWDVRHRRVKALSLGMRQKLGIACALLGNPDMLMLDEPTNGLDPVSIAEIRKLLTDLNRRGVTIVISSHILGEMEKIATDYAFIINGKIVSTMSATDLENTGKSLEDYFLDIVGGNNNE